MEQCPKCNYNLKFLAGDYPVCYKCGWHGDRESIIECNLSSVNGLRWHRLTAISHGDEFIEVMAATSIDGVGVIVRWENGEQGWKASVMDTESGGWQFVDFTDEANEIPEEPPSAWDDLTDDIKAALKFYADFKNYITVAGLFDEYLPQSARIFQEKGGVARKVFKGGSDNKAVPLNSFSSSHCVGCRWSIYCGCSYSCGKKGCEASIAGKPKQEGCFEQSPKNGRGMNNSDVFVDDAIYPYGRMMMCHMMSKDVEALHAMASKIGIARKWFQNKKGRTPHYDICKSKRALAVKFGAIETDRRGMVEIIRHFKTIPTNE